MDESAAVGIEEELDVAFADAFRDSQLFFEWVLRKTKFRVHLPDVRLMHEEQRTLRPRKHWAKWWFCRVPELGNRESETDIFLIMEIKGEQRVCLHVENKPWKGKLSIGQAASYRPRARHMMAKPKFMDYADFETIIIAPAKFLEENRTDASLFDLRISYEEIGRFVPRFAAES